MSSSHIPSTAALDIDFVPISTPSQLVQLFQQKAASRQEQVVTVQARCIDTRELEPLEDLC